jgi:hypothetical protein
MTRTHAIQPFPPVWPAPTWSSGSTTDANWTAFDELRAALEDFIEITDLPLEVWFGVPELSLRSEGIDTTLYLRSAHALVLLFRDGQGRSWVVCRRPLNGPGTIHEVRDQADIDALCQTCIEALSTPALEPRPPLSAPN